MQQKTAETIRIANKWEADGTRREVSITIILIVIKFQTQTLNDGR